MSFVVAVLFRGEVFLNRVPYSFFESLKTNCARSVFCEFVGTFTRAVLARIVSLLAQRTDSAPGSGHRGRLGLASTAFLCRVNRSLSLRGCTYRGGVLESPSRTL